MDVRDLVEEDLVTLHLRATDKNTAITELAQMMDEAGKLYSVEEYSAAVYEREAITSTSVGYGIAIPHARASAVKSPAIAIAKSEGIPWDDNSDELIRLIFLLAVPEENEDNNYIQMLASLARMLMHADFRKALMEAESVQEIVSALSSNQIERRKKD